MVFIGLYEPKEHATCAGCKFQRVTDDHHTSPSVPPMLVFFSSEGKPLCTGCGLAHLGSASFPALELGQALTALRARLHRHRGEEALGDERRAARARNAQNKIRRDEEAAREAAFQRSSDESKAESVDELTRARMARKGAADHGQNPA